MLDSKLQIKPGQTVAILHNPHPISVAASLAEPEKSDVVLVFASNIAQLQERASMLAGAGKRGALVWLAYPKAKQLGTDLNRNIIHDLMPAYGLDAVRQVAIDDTWSAMRFKYIG